VKNIRNFCIIAHIDHGKSTLADRLLELTNTVEKREMRAQHLDTMELEQERGITIKLQPVRMEWKNVELNLIDTPGHADFSYEVSRSLKAVEGALLIIDATQGIEAQTLANVYSAIDANLEIIPVVNKIDLPAADVEKVATEIENVLSIPREELIEISAKDGTNCEKVLDAVIERIPPPKNLDEDNVAKALIFDSIFDTYRGVVIYVRNFAGKIRKGEKLKLLRADTEFEALEVGCLKPKYSPTGTIGAGEIGYIVTGLHSVRDARVGETVWKKGKRKTEDEKQSTDFEIKKVKTEKEKKLCADFITRELYERGEISPKSCREITVKSYELPAFFVVQNGEIVGVIRLKPQGILDEIYHNEGDAIAQIMVKKESRKKNFGSILLKKGEEYFAKKGITQLFMWSREHAVKFYESNGWKRSSKKEPHIFNGMQKIYLEKELSEFTARNSQLPTPLPGYKKVAPFVFAGIFANDADDYPELRDALGKLSLNDASLSYEPERSTALGFGFRVGFLGLLHLEIIQERLEREYNLDLIVTAPSVKYEMILGDGKIIPLANPGELPDIFEELREPWVRLEIVTPKDYLGGILELVTKRRGVQKNLSFLDPTRTLVEYEMPLASIVTDFYDKLKNVSSGYASMSYEFLEFRTGDLVRLDVLVGREKIDALSFVVHKSEARPVGLNLVKKLKDIIPRANFVIPIQAAIGATVIARETLSAFRKDVTAKLYGGDVTRKNKLLKKQKAGKKRMKQFGKVSLPQEAFLAVLKRD